MVLVISHVGLLLLVALFGSCSAQQASSGKTIVNDDSAEGSRQPECIDPSEHQLFKEEAAAHKSTIDALKQEVKQCMETAVSAEDAAQLAQSIDDLKAQFYEKEKEAVELRQDVKEKMSMIKELKNSIASQEARAASADEAQQKEARQRIDDLEATVRQREAALQGAPKTDSYLFSKAQLVDRVSQFSGFGKEVFHLCRGMLKAAGLSELLARLVEARVELTAAIDPKLAPLRPHWMTVKGHVANTYATVRNLYLVHADAFVLKCVGASKSALNDFSVIANEGVKFVNDGASEILKPLFEKRMPLKAYFPEDPLDRVCFFGYIVAVVYTSLKLSMCLAVRPVVRIAGFLVSYTLCRRRPLKTQEHKDDDKRAQKNVHGSSKQRDVHAPHKSETRKSGR